MPDIALKNKSPLVILPTEDLAKYAAFEQAVSSESEQIYSHSGAILKELLFGPM